MVVLLIRHIFSRVHSRGFVLALVTFLFCGFCVVYFGFLLMNGHFESEESIPDGRQPNFNIQKKTKGICPLVSPCLSKEIYSNSSLIAIACFKGSPRHQLPIGNIKRH